MTVQHPIHSHLVITPSAGGEGFELGPSILVMRQLRFFRELLRALRRAVATINRQPDIRQVIVPFRRAGMIKPPLVYGPELLGGYELLETFVRWNAFVITLLGRRTARAFVGIGEPVRRRTPAIRTFHSNTVPDFIAIGILIKCRHGIYDCALPM